MISRRPSTFALIVTILLLLPLVVVVGMSINPGAYSVFPPQGFSLRWFQAALTNPQFVQALGLSVEIALLSTILGTLISVSAALAITRLTRRLRISVQATVLGPLVVPEVMLGLGLLLTVNAVFGVGSSGLWSLVAGHVLVGIPLAVQVLVAGLAGVNPTLERAAYTLGASRVQAFLRVTMPQVGTALGSAAVLLFIFSFDNISMSLFLSKPGRTTLPIYLYQYIEYRADPTVAAMSTVLILVGVIAAAVLGRVGGVMQIAGRRAHEVR